MISDDGGLLHQTVYAQATMTGEHCVAVRYPTPYALEPSLLKWELEGTPRGFERSDEDETGFLITFEEVPDDVPSDTTIIFEISGLDPR